MIIMRTDVAILNAARHYGEGAVVAAVESAVGYYPTRPTTQTEQALLRRARR